MSLIEFLPIKCSYFGESNKFSCFTYNVSNLTWLNLGLLSC